MIKNSIKFLGVIFSCLSLSVYTNVLASTQNFSFNFDYPVGKPNASGWQNKQDFGTLNIRFGGYHLGEDWNYGSGEADANKPVFAISNGLVRFSRNSGPVWGRVIIIEHQLPNGSKFYSQYGHLNDAEAINENTIVVKGQQIGTIRRGISKPFSMSAHLHFEIRTDDNPIKLQPGPGYSRNLSGWLDPSDFIDSHRQLLSSPRPVTLSISESTFNSVTLYWTKNQSPYFSSYKLYRSGTSPVTESSQLISTITDENQINYLDSGVSPKTNYFYKLFTCNIASQCTGSNEVSVSTQRDPNDLGKIVYTSQVNGLSQIFLMKGNSSNITQLRFSQCNDKTPKWSPDGKKILFSSIDSQTGNRQVFLMNEDGTEVRKITNSKYGAQQADWFPSGDKIVYLGWEEGFQTKTAVKGIYVLSLSGGSPKLLTPPTLSPSNPGVTPDGQKIVFQASYIYDNQKGGLFMVNASGSGLVQLTHENDSDPEISPDGKKLVFSSTRDTNNNLFWNIYLTIEEFTGIVFNLTGKGGGSNIEPSWSSDSKKIIYSSRESIYDDYEINILDLETSQRTTLTSNNQDDREPDWFFEE